MAGGDSQDQAKRLLDSVAALVARDDAVPALYDRLAPSYDSFRTLWIGLAERPAERALLQDVAACLTPRVRVLDAGCGTGALARKLSELEPGAKLTMLDASSGMLARAGDVKGERLLGDVRSLPFDDGEFDVVVSGWVIETLDDPVAAVSEFVRVVDLHGRVLYMFCSLPGGWVSRAGTKLLRETVEHGFAGRFLPPARTPWHDCERSHRCRFQGGLTSEIALAKCCTVEAGVVPTAAEASG